MSRYRRLARNTRGFSLLELLVTLAVVSILLTVGVPNLSDFVGNNRAAGSANELVTALAVARSEAIRRGARVSVCRSTDGATCGGSWQQGWIVFLDGAANDGAAPVVSEVLRVWPAPEGNPNVATLSDDGTSVDMAWVRFLPRGSVRADSVTMPLSYELTFQGCSGLQGRIIELNTVGHTAVERIQCG